MFRSKPIEIFRTLSSTEVRKLGDFLQAPTYARHEPLQKLYALLRKAHPSLEQSWIKREHLFARVFENEPYAEKRLRYLFSDMAKAMEAFLIQLEFEAADFQQDRLLLQAYRKRRLDKHYMSLHKRVARQLEDHPYRNATYLGMRFQFEKASYEYEASRRSHNLDTNLQQVVDRLDLWFLANKLKFSCEILNNRGVVKVELQLFLLDEILSYLKDRDLHRYPMIAVYLQVLLTLTEGDQPQHYRKLLELLEQHRKHFPASEVFDLYVYAKNYCIRNINQGKVEYTRELFDFYNIILSEGIIFRDGHLTQWDFKNLVTLGLRLGEFDWTTDFLERYRDKLRPTERDNVVAYNRANLAFHRGAYGETLELLQQVEFTDVYYHLDSKALLLKTYYETEEWEPLGALIEAFKVFLKRNKQISDYQSIVYGNLVRFTNTLIRFRRGRKVDLAKLRQNVETTRQIANIAWLREKLDEAQAAS